MAEFAKAANAEPAPRSPSPDPIEVKAGTSGVGRVPTPQPRLAGSAPRADDDGAAPASRDSARTARQTPSNDSKTESAGSARQSARDAGKDPVATSSTQGPLSRTGSVGRRPPSRAGKSIPPFYFPQGKPEADAATTHEARLKRCREIFKATRQGTLEVDDFSAVTIACGLPRHLSLALFLAVDKEGTGVATLPAFEKVYADVLQRCHDLPSRVFHLLKQPGSDHLVRTDFHPLLADVVNAHPGLAFLRETPEFQERYVETVIGRIFFEVNRSWSGRISLPELARSNFVSVLSSLDTQPDINKVG